MRVSLRSQETIVLRDGRPFGDAGMFGGNSLDWPQPQTLAGMIRTKIGHERAFDYFSKKDNIEKIKELGLQKILPSLYQEGSEPVSLAFVPADLVFFPKGSVSSSQWDSDQELGTQTASYRSLPEGAGTDLGNPEWLYPVLESREKPATERPFLLYWQRFADYLEGKGLEGVLSELGTKSPVVQEQFHNALDLRTGTTEEGRLFLNRAIHLQINHTKDGQQSSPREYGIDFTVSGLSDQDKAEGPAYLGGERKRVHLGSQAAPYPECPKIFAGESFLKLILMTPGDFGSWCPDWLMPDLDASSISWVSIPGTDHHIRLRSASLSGWSGISGWDYAKRRPKASKKLLNAGSVFIIEVQDPGTTQEVAEYLWGNSINTNQPQSLLDGYGQVVVGKVDQKS